MVTRSELLALEFYKLRPFKGSDRGLRYMIQKETVEKPCENAEAAGEETVKETETVLMTYLWPEPFCFEATPDDKKMKKYFEFSEEGLVMAVDWINENHDKYAYIKGQ